MLLLHIFWLSIHKTCHWQLLLHTLVYRINCLWLIICSNTFISISVFCTKKYTPNSWDVFINADSHIIHYAIITYQTGNADARVQVIYLILEYCNSISRQWICKRVLSSVTLLLLCLVAYLSVCVFSSKFWILAV